MASLSLALKTLRSQVASALTAAGLSTESGSVFIGWPTSTELAKVVGQNTGKSQISIFPGPGKPDARYRPEPFIPGDGTPATPGTTGTLNTAQTVLTIGGTPAVGDVIHAFFFDQPVLDANYEVVKNDTPISVAAGIAASVNSYGARGVTAAASGAVVTLTGAAFSKVNIGAQTAMLVEVEREIRTVFVDVWAPDAGSREDIGNAILAAVGTTISRWADCTDGTSIRVQQSGNDRWIDDAESSYTTFRWTIPFEIEYGITQQLLGTQVESVEVNETITYRVSNNNVIATQYIGGP